MDEKSYIQTQHPYTPYINNHITNNHKIVWRIKSKKFFKLKKTTFTLKNKHTKYKLIAECKNNIGLAKFKNCQLLLPIKDPFTNKHIFTSYFPNPHPRIVYIRFKVHKSTIQKS